MEVQRSRRDVQPELAYLAEPARSGAMLWKAPLAAIVGGTTSSASFRRAAGASEFPSHLIPSTFIFGRDYPSFSRRIRISVASFSLSPSARVTRLDYSLHHLFLCYINTYPCHNVISLTWRHPCPCFTGRICTQRL